MKKLANLKGAKTLNKKEQQSINGGAPDKPLPDATIDCRTTGCPAGQCCGVKEDGSIGCIPTGDWSHCL